jgi:SAM-dependent methyltransferase
MGCADHRHLMAALGEKSRNALEIDLRPATLRIGGVSPVQPRDAHRDTVVKKPVPWVGYRHPVSKPVPEVSPWRATVARSRRLFADFLVEQSDPDRFYRALAADSAGQVDSWHPLTGALMLDVGGGPGFFQSAFEASGAAYIAVDADAGEMRLHGRSPSSRTVQADGRLLPFATASFDVTYSSNVAEHVDEPWRMADEMVRVTRPGGTVVLSYTLWWGPWGGHETSPWHLLGGERAARRYRRRMGHEPKNRFGSSLFPITLAEGERWARRQRRAELLAVVPRYFPGWARSVAMVPVLREAVCWNAMFVLRRRDVP